MQQTLTFLYTGTSTIRLKTSFRVVTSVGLLPCPNQIYVGGVLICNMCSIRVVIVQQIVYYNNKTANT